MRRKGRCGESVALALSVPHAQSSAAAAQGKLKDRELEKWSDGGGDETPGIGDGALSGPSGDFDQFAVNAKKFGVKASFDESQYTTRKVEGSAAQRRAAEKLAKEMAESGKGGDEVDDGRTEEERHSAVVRGAPSKPAGGGGFTDGAVNARAAGKKGKR